VNGERIRALRYARETVNDLRWRRIAVPPVYLSMADEFRALVRSGEYAAWLTGGIDKAAHGPAGRSA
jgi:hypothetical protein